MLVLRAAQTAAVVAAAAGAGVLLATLFVSDVTSDADAMDAVFRTQAAADAAKEEPPPPPPSSQ